MRYCSVVGASSAASLANSSGLQATLTTFPAALLTITLAASHTAIGLHVHRAAAVQINFPPAGPSVPIVVTASQEPLVAGVTTIALSIAAAAWSPFLSAGNPLVSSVPDETCFASPSPPASCPVSLWPPLTTSFRNTYN